MGKGSARRPCTVSDEEAEVRWALAFDELSPTARGALTRRLIELETERGVPSDSKNNTDESDAN